MDRRGPFAGHSVLALLDSPLMTEPTSVPYYLPPSPIDSLCRRHTQGKGQPVRFSPIVGEAGKGEDVFVWKSNRYVFK